MTCLEVQTTINRMNLGGPGRIHGETKASCLSRIRRSKASFSMRTGVSLKLVSRPTTKYRLQPNDHHFPSCLFVVSKLSGSR